MEGDFALSCIFALTYSIERFIRVREVFLLNNEGIFAAVNLQLR